MGGIKDILVLHHSHLDLGYTHSQPVMKALQVEYLDQALELLDSTADWPEISKPKWTCEVTQPVIWWLEQADREMVSHFKTYLESGRLAISALSYNGTPLSDAVSLSHQFRNKKYLEERFGLEIKTVNIHDVNGIPWPLVDMMLDEGIELLTMAVNTHLGRQLDERPGVFRWEGPSGRSILVMNGAHYTMFDQNLYSWESSVERMQAGWKEYSDYLEGKKYPYDFCYLTTTHAPQMWDNSPPNPFTAGLIREWNERNLYPSLRYVTPEDLLRRIKQQDPETIPLKSGDWTDYWIFGSGAAAHETKVTREARRLLFAADLAGAFTGWPVYPGQAEKNKKSRLVQDQIALYEEHTWGSYDTSVTNEQHTAQEHIKTNSAYIARENAFFRLVEELDILAGNKKSADRIKGLLIYNPSASFQDVYLSISPQWRTAGRFIRANRFQNENFVSDRIGELCGPISIGPYCYQKVGLEDLNPIVQSDELSYTIDQKEESRFSLNIDFSNALLEGKPETTGSIRSKWYELQFDSESGHILSLIDRIRGREILSCESAGFFEFIREHPDGLIDESRISFFKRNLEKEKRDISNWQEWQVVYEKAKRVVSFSVEEYPHEIVHSTIYEAPGVRRFTRRITIRSNSALIGIDISFTKEVDDNPEGLYFHIPLSLGEGWKAHYDTAGVPTELDAEQLPGSCRGWQCVDNYLSMHEDDFGAVLFCPDAPLVMAGGFNFGPPMEQIARHANPGMIAWPMNNYWDTNFGRIQPGFKHFKYEFMTHGHYNPVELAGISDRVRNPVVSIPSSSEPSASTQLIHCDSDDVTILGVRILGENEGIHITLVNNSLIELETLLTTIQKVKKAWVSTASGYAGGALVVKEGAVHLKLASRRITFIGFSIS